MLPVFPCDLQPQIMALMRPWGAGRPVSTQGDGIPPFTSQPSDVHVLEVIADRLPSTASFEDVFYEHRDIGSIMWGGNAMMRIGFPVFLE